MEISSNFAPEAFYADFEQFLARHEGMVGTYGMNYVLAYMLVRLTRDDVEKGRRVFNWAVKRVCVNMLADKRFPPVGGPMSAQSLEWAERAEDLFGRNPIKSLRMVEGVFLLERLALWAEIELRNRFGSKVSLVEFRKRPQNNEEAISRGDWLDIFYQQARVQAMEESQRYVQRRNCAIALAITSMAGEFTPRDEEIEEAMSSQFPTHQSLSKWAADRRGSGSPLLSTQYVAEWVLGPEPVIDQPF